MIEGTPVLMEPLSATITVLINFRPMKVQFRKATENDSPQILEMMEAFYAIYEYPFSYDTMQRSLRIFLESEQWGLFWLVEVDDEIAGYMVLTFGFSFEHGGRDSILDELYLKPDHRHHGIGKLAIKFLTETCKDLNIKAVHLEVEKHNTPAHKLYQRQGFLPNHRSWLTKPIDQE